MVDTRRNEDGFRGQYPAPLDWSKIIRELESKEGNTGEPADTRAPEPE